MSLEPVMHCGWTFAGVNSGDLQGAGEPDTKNLT